MTGFLTGQDSGCLAVPGVLSPGWAGAWVSGVAPLSLLTLVPGLRAHQAHTSLGALSRQEAFFWGSRGTASSTACCVRGCGLALTLSTHGAPDWEHGGP